MKEKVTVLYEKDGIAMTQDFRVRHKVGTDIKTDTLFLIEGGVPKRCLKFDNLIEKPPLFRVIFSTGPGQAGLVSMEAKYHGHHNNGTPCVTILPEEIKAKLNKLHPTLDPKWKYKAKDADGDIRLFTHKPISRKKIWDFMDLKDGQENCRSPFVDHNPDQPWKESLCEIVEGWFIPVVELPKLKIDQKVLVWDEDEEGHPGEKEKAHFAEWNKDGTIMTFVDGKTSFSAFTPLSIVGWDNYEIVEEE